MLISTYLSRNISANRWEGSNGTNVQPYLAFEGCCDEAIEFYKKAIGGKVEMLMRFKDAPDQSMVTPGNKDKVMHAALRAGDAMILMLDGRCTGSPNFNGIALALSAANDADAERMFNALAEGGSVNMPMAKTFFASRFGMLSDKFGVGWMVLTPSS
jgi:PhnB protein